MTENDFKHFNFTVLGTDSRIEGELTLAGDTIINSDIQGTISMKNESALTFEREGSIEGIVNCHDLEVFGKIQGTINASGVVRIRSGAIVAGVVNAKSLSVFPGAILNIDGHTVEQTEHSPTDEYSKV